MYYQKSYRLVWSVPLPAFRGSMYTKRVPAKTGARFLQSLYCTSVYAYKLFLRSVFCKEKHVEVQALYAHFWNNNSQLSSVVQLLNSAGKEVFCFLIVLLIASSISEFFTVEYGSIHSFMQIIAVCFSFHFFYFSFSPDI